MDQYWQIYSENPKRGVKQSDINNAESILQASLKTQNEEFDKDNNNNTVYIL